MMYYTSSHLPESGGHLLITSLTHNKKIASSIDIVSLANVSELFSLNFPAGNGRTLRQIMT